MKYRNSAESRTCYVSETVESKIPIFKESVEVKVDGIQEDTKLEKRKTGKKTSDGKSPLPCKSPQC